MGTLTTKTNTRIPVPLNDEEDELQLGETLKRSKVEKRAPNVPYLENVGPLGLEQQWMALKEATTLKAAREAALTRGEGTSQQQGAS